MACASLFGAGLSDANLTGAFLRGAEKMTEEAWEEFKKRYF
jgi:uncharacterized protein YjbI with pentapeptide repeats